MYKKSLWYISICITFVSLLVFVVGFVKAVSFASVPTTGTNQLVSQKATRSTSGGLSNRSNVLHIVLMGDSIAKGTGDEKGKGIGGYLVDLLKSQTPKDLQVDNLGVDGYKIQDLANQLSSGKDDNLIKNADFLIISIGGSELQQIQSAQSIQKDQSFQTEQGTFVSELQDILKKIRTLNKTTQIIMIGNYNPLSVVNTTDNVSYLDTWTYKTQLVLANDDRATFIPTYNIFKNNLNRFISSDKQNPNSTGYQTIAYLLSKSVENTLSKH
ncbi:GDSL-type esterase/lipase family protein [Desulfosporosinus sp. SB140]|uniref:GDSL-type esterase/lipase family protein n=1 Tax=Desulfosporosinus paludis TaxID=3115649 RepID=UPI0038909E7B